MRKIRLTPNFFCIGSLRLQITLWARINGTISMTTLTIAEPSASGGILRRQNPPARGSQLLSKGVQLTMSMMKKVTVKMAIQPHVA